MKKQLFRFALLLGLGTSVAHTSFAATTAIGQEQRQDRDHDHGKGDQKGQRGAQYQQRRLDQMAKDLDLSSKDKGKVEKIFQEQQQQMQALHSRSNSTDRSQAMAERKRIQESTDKKLKDVLSKKQYAQFEAKRQERQRQMADRHNDRRGNDRRDASRRS